MKMIFATLAIATLIPLASNAKENTSADAQAVDAACAADAQTAGCGAEKVGTGLMKCLHAYHKAHKDVKMSPACHDAMKKEHMDKKGAAGAPTAAPAQ